MIGCFFKTGLFLTIYFSCPSFVCAQQTAKHEPNKQAYEIGLMVQALQLAIKSPQKQDSLQIISDYGTDRRYYTMIRGWLFEELVGVEKRLHASKNVKEIAGLQLKSDSLKRAIRSIDTQ
ncbi:hypothetical protein [Psychromonas sp.]|uniref:hypothetical protein n=1 Tax=Psychromonas sp. TaxID=1884585 RepID=UPI0035660981